MTHDQEHPTPVRRIATTVIALMLLLALTAGLSLLDLGDLGLAAALSVSATKAVIVGLVFMDLRRSPLSTRTVAAVAVFWVALLMAGSMMDVTSRPPARPVADRMAVEALPPVRAVR